MDYQTFPQKLKALRKQNHLSQSQFGEQVGVSNRAVSKWENGESMPSTEKLLRIAALFSVPLNALLSEDVSPQVHTAVEGMPSLKELYRIGSGPSSSHTMAPQRAAEYFRIKYPDADRFEAELFGSLAKMGKVYHLDSLIRETFAPKKAVISLRVGEDSLPHPCTMRFCAYSGKNLLGKIEAYSTGGGSFRIKGEELSQNESVYPEHSYTEIASYCEQKRIRLWQYAEEKEGSQLWDYLSEVWKAMVESIESGLSEEGVLEGGLGVQRKAKFLYSQSHIDESAETRENRLVCAYAFAVSEQNASFGKVVTAPTCGAAGVLPAVLRYAKEKRGFSDREILQSLATAGIVGNLIKTNASVIGAECGCQAEIGSACAMAAAALGELYGMSLNQIEYAAEIAIEHHLGLTCDPIKGLVQIPCIERNAVAAMRAINAVNLANFLSDTRKISFDLVVKTMYETGRDLSRVYKETSEGGLAKLYL